MKEYSIGQVSRLLNVKPYIIRYWEKEISLISPRKNIAGRRVYSEMDLQILYRLKYLVQEKGYTLSGAGKCIWEDFNSSDPGIIGNIRHLRSELLRLLDIIDRGRYTTNMKDLII